MKFSKNWSNILHLRREKLKIVTSGTGLSGDELCLTDEQCKHDWAVHPNILGCIKRVVVGLEHCPVRAAEEMGLVQFGEELTSKGHNSSFTASGRGSSRRGNIGLCSCVWWKGEWKHHKLNQKRFHLEVRRRLFLLRTVISGMGNPRSLERYWKTGWIKFWASWSKLNVEHKAGLNNLLISTPNWMLRLDPTFLAILLEYRVIWLSLNI